jgi:hypothetical protein
MKPMTSAAGLSPPTGGVLIASSNPSRREQVLSSLPRSGDSVHQVGCGANALLKRETGNGADPARDFQ